jgi:hypothetical protein
MIAMQWGSEPEGSARCSPARCQNKRGSYGKSIRRQAQGCAGTHGRFNFALVQLSGNCVMAGYSARLYLADHWQDVSCKLIGCGFPCCRAMRRRLREPGIA